MITAGYAATMAAYNAEMNRRTFAAAARLSDAERRADRGAFFGSIHGTLNHLLWADHMWMARFDGWDKPAITGRESPHWYADFAELRTRREETDARLSGWAARVEPEWLRGDLTWFSGVAQREVTKPVALLVVHLFNHQTHHRGQVHAMLTAAGEDTGDTDVWCIV